MIEPERLREMNNKPERPGARFVLYWMQQSQRVRANHALEFAIAEANRLSLPLVVTFGITDNYPEASERAYSFMIHGLKEVGEGLRARGIPFVMRHKSPECNAVEFAAEAALVVMDLGYTRIQKQWRAYVAAEAPCRVVQVESEVIVPLEAASNKDEWAAATYRPKVNKLLPKYLVPVTEESLATESLSLRFDSLDWSQPDDVVRGLRINRDVPPSRMYRGGYAAANALLEHFIANDFAGYATNRNEPAANRVSHMSMYLHFGQISPLEIALRLRAAGGGGADVETYLEEMVVRRELAHNFVHFNPDYDKYEALPNWARASLGKHANDKRTYVYSFNELERAQTHDVYWNAAQNEMVHTGKMHNYMRMYWGKKILEWSETPEVAFSTALALNNKWQIDGRNPNSFCGVAWCFGKHDRPWVERPIFGQIRYMNDAGLKRKFDMAGYLRRVAEESGGAAKSTGETADFFGG